MSKPFINPLFRGYYKCEENDPEETECNGEYIEGSCECCDHFEQCLITWREDEE